MRFFFALFRPKHLSCTVEVKEFSMSDEEWRRVEWCHEICIDFAIPRDMEFFVVFSNAHLHVMARMTHTYKPQFFLMILVVERKTVKLCADKRRYRLFLCSKIYWLGWKQWNSVPAEQDKRMQPNIGDAPKIRDPRWSRTKCPGWSITTSHNVTQCQPKVMSFRKENFVISRRGLPVGEWF